MTTIPPAPVIAPRPPEAGERRVKVWDLPTRIFHWGLVASVGLAYASGEVLPKSWIGAHAFFGYVIAGLIAFRLFWGVFGPEPSRFKSFLYSPRAVLDYARRMLALRPPFHLGHNPLGALMVFALLATLALLIASGIVALGGTERLGPLAGQVSFAFAKAAEHFHEGVVGALGILVGLHVVGVLLSSLAERQNLIRAMIDGCKRVPAGVRFTRPEPARLAAAALALAVFGAVVAAAYAVTPNVVMGAALFRASTDPARLTRLAAYERECGDCHVVYHPSLLPAGRWSAVMDGLADHYGEDATLAEADHAAIAAYLSAHAAENWDTKAANVFRFAAPSLENSRASPAEGLPISGAPRWKRIHRKIDAATFARKDIGGRSNCAACHADARTGLFRLRDSAIPDKRDSAIPNKRDSAIPDPKPQPAS